MMEPDVTISARYVGKSYFLFKRPQDRLKNMLFWRLGRRYGEEFWALRGVSFDLYKGEMLGIIGKNGSGKSTLLQIIAGILKPTEGEIECEGRIGALLELGSGFNLEYTGRENIYINASILGLSPDEIEDKIDDIIAFADIGEFIDQPVKLYSSGMFIRLAFAITTGVNADALLIDEALAVGDVFFRQKCYNRLKQLLNKGTSIILVSHSMADIEQYCTRCILLDHGMVKITGSGTDVVKHYYLLEQGEFRKDVRDNRAPDWETVHKDEISSQDQFWPSQEAFFDLSSLAQISSGGGICTGIAMCDSKGAPARRFDQGEDAHFYYEFKLDADIQVPNAGIVIYNDQGIIIHGKNTLMSGSDVPGHVAAGSKIRFHQVITLDLAVGEYTFQVALNQLSYNDYLMRSALTHEELYARINRISFLTNLGPFIIVTRKITTPVQQLHHGIVNLPGACYFYQVNS